MPLNSGEKLGPYEVVAPLGAGGMGEVYRARDTRLGRDVAIKILPKEMSADPVRKKRFEQEAKTISGLNHPNICVLHDVGSHDGVDYLVMECVEGETLAERLKKGPLPLEQVLRYGAQIADALDKAHRSGVVHRDLKPGNIMLTQTGAKLLDFGLARPTATRLATLATMTGSAPASPMTQEGAIVGTFQYMSPEQVEGKELDGRSDIFSLGAVLYEMVTGRRAFEGKSQLSVASAILEKEPQPITAAKPMAPAALERTIRKCLTKEAEKRWQSAGDLASELNWIAEAGVRSDTGSVSVVRRRAPILWLLAAGALLVLLVGAGIALLVLGKKEARAEHFAAPFQLLANSMALSSDGQKIALVAFSEQKNNYVIWTYGVGEKIARPVEGTEDASHPFWSPDGQWIGFFAQGKLKKVNETGSVVQSLADAPNGRGGSWNKDGVILYTPDVFVGVHRVPASGGASAEITQLDATRSDSSHRWPRFLPDGKHFVYLAANFAGKFDKNAIFLGALDSNERREVVNASSNAIVVEPGYLLYVRDSDKALVAQKFDLKSFVVSGEARVVQTEVQYVAQVDEALFDVAGERTLAAQTGKGAILSQFVWYDRNGKSLGAVGPPCSCANPALSPDGKRVAFDQTDPSGRKVGIWTRDFSSEVVSRLTLHQGLNQMAVWSPDAKRVVFSSNREVFNRVYIKNADGSGAEERFANFGAQQQGAWDWSRDGKYVLVRDGSELWCVAASDRQAKPYLQEKFSLKNAQFSPDGKWVAYASNESGAWEVYVSPFPVASSKWQVSRGGGEEPRWRDDGKEMFYLSADRKLTAVDVKTGEQFEVGAATELFQVRPRQKISSQDVFSYAVTKDGGRFLINTVMSEASAAPLLITFDWVSELGK